MILPQPLINQKPRRLPGHLQLAGVNVKLLEITMMSGRYLSLFFLTHALQKKKHRACDFSSEENRVA